MYDDDIAYCNHIDEFSQFSQSSASLVIVLMFMRLLERDLQLTKSDEIHISRLHEYMLICIDV